MKRIGEILEKAMAKAGLAGELEVTRIRAAWEGAAGHDASWALPWAVKDGVLTLSVPTAAHRGEAQLKAGIWTARLHEAMPGAGIRQIRAVTQVQLQGGHS